MKSPTAAENSKLNSSSLFAAACMSARLPCTCASVSSGTMSSAAADMMHDGKKMIGSTMPCIVP